MTQETFEVWTKENRNPLYVEVLVEHETVMRNCMLPNVIHSNTRVPCKTWKMSPCVCSKHKMLVAHKLQLSNVCPLTGSFNKSRLLLFHYNYISLEVLVIESWFAVPFMIKRVNQHTVTHSGYYFYIINLMQAMAN